MHPAFKKVVAETTDIKRFLYGLTLILAMVWASSKSIAQQKGYKEIQIGSNIHDLISNTKYRFLASKTVKTDYYAEMDTAVICGMPVDHLKITLDNNDIVTEVFVYTKQEVLPDYSAFSNKLRSVLFTIKDNLGTPVYSNISKGDIHLLTIWDFEETKTMLSVRTDDVSTFAKDFKTNYLFIWQIDTNKVKGNAMW
jgi:hypothetical protein